MLCDEDVLRTSSVRFIFLDMKQIAKGQKRGKFEYPTMDDVVSDWNTDETRDKPDKPASYEGTLLEEPT
ncbi:unnamed protein product [Anisakis simplex]|uniref:GYF_2 domain-containing protein n=1 Tax=Anisakis simplex TaxID=6269 RepID=A0A0M3JBD3_ANISI|nr:unnamed protein product [Anisakis simplex]